MPGIDGYERFGAKAAAAAAAAATSQISKVQPEPAVFGCQATDGSDAAGAAVLRCGGAANGGVAKAALRCCGKAGAAGTAVATVDGRHFGAANCGVAESVLRLLRNFGTSVLLWSIVDCRRLAQHPCRFSSGPRVGLQLRPAVLRSADIKADGCDGGGDFGPRILVRPVFPGDRGANMARKRSWAAAWAELVGGDRRLAAGWIRGGRSWRSAGGTKLAGSAELLWGGFPGTGARSGRKWMLGLARGGRSSRALSGRIGESCFWTGFTELARWAAICPGGMAGDFGESWWSGRNFTEI
jgi:hypothetical protein